MPHKTPSQTSRLRELFEQLERAQHESGGLVRQARREVAGAMSAGNLKPVGTAGALARKKKAGGKKR